MGISLMPAVNAEKAKIYAELPGCALRGANELRNAAQEVLGHGGSGRRYGGHTASAPGEPPAPISGNLRDEWQPCSMGWDPCIESFIPYTWLEWGSPGGKIKARPYAEQIKAKAYPHICEIYQSIGR